MVSFDVGSDEFEKIVIEGSNKVPVVVDFWAEWCGPCKMLKPVLEKLAEEYQGKFILAKVDSDANQALAGQYGVRGIPNVKAFLGGKVIDEFSGALSESEVRAFLDRIIPSPGEELRLQAVQSLEAGDPERALSQLLEAQGLDPDNERIKVDLARVYLTQGDTDTAKQQIETLPLALRMEDEVAELVSKIEFAEKSRDLPDEATLLQRLQADDKDLEARLQLANRYISEQRYAEAMDQLLEIIRMDRGFQDDIGRKTMLSVFTLLGDQDDLVRQYRRRMAALLN
jgi:putative thioredoxin